MKAKSKTSEGTVEKVEVGRGTPTRERTESASPSYASPICFY